MILNSQRKEPTRFLFVYFLSVFTSVEAAINGTVQISCPAGYMLLYCGMRNTQTSQFFERRYAMPINSTSCECRDDYGMKCIAWCANKGLEGFEIAINRTSSPLNRNELMVTCPIGKLVVGCNLEPFIIEYHAFYSLRTCYPYNFGSSCFCHDFDGAKWTAVCALNIQSYEIAKKFGNFDVTVSCSRPNNVVLGCGIYVSGNEETTFWRHSYTVNETTCACYAEIFLQCFAICGFLGT